MNRSKVLYHLYSALEHARKACERTRQLVVQAIRKFQALCGLEDVFTERPIDWTRKEELESRPPWYMQYILNQP